MSYTHVKREQRSSWKMGSPRRCQLGRSQCENQLWNIRGRWALMHDCLTSIECCCRLRSWPWCQGPSHVGRSHWEAGRTGCHREAESGMGTLWIEEGKGGNVTNFTGESIYSYCQVVTLQQFAGAGCSSLNHCYWLFEYRNVVTVGLLVSSSGNFLQW